MKTIQNDLTQLLGIEKKIVDKFSEETVQYHWNIVYDMFYSDDEIAQFRNRNRNNSEFKGVFAESFEVLVSLMSMVIILIQLIK